MFLLMACASPVEPLVEDSDRLVVDDPLADAKALLTGRFDSSAQATEDPSYYAVSLVACEVEAPELGDDVLYIEQALVSALDDPYRQRFYALSAAEGVVTSVIWELDRPRKGIGLCDGTGELSDPILREGCDVTLVRDDEGFVGSTVDGACSSDLNGASYATSEVLLRPDRIESWDRGFDDDGQQIWGATAGAYVFLRLE